MNNNSTGYLRHGRGAAGWYLYGNQALAYLTKTALGAVELERNHQGRCIYRTAFQIGASVVNLLDSESSDSLHPLGTTYFFVPDVDAVYQGILMAGAI